MEQDAYNREMNDQKMALEHEKLGEIRDYHNQSLMAKMANGVGQTVDYEGKPYKKLDKVEQRKANNVKKAINTSQHELDKIDTELSNLKDITKNNTYAPMGGVSFIANPVKDFIGDVFDIKDYQDETAKRKLLYATLGKFRVNAERALKGQGVLGQGFYDRLSPFFPNEKDSLPTLEEKLKDLNREMALEAQAANISADQGIAYDISDLPETEEGTQPIPDQNGYVAIVNIKTGKTGKVHLEDLEEAKNRGWDLK
jgi:hypothetical protein